MNEEKKCASCGKPADVEITPTIHPLTARGEQTWEKVNKADFIGKSSCVCLECIAKAIEALEDRDEG